MKFASGEFYYRKVSNTLIIKGLGATPKYDKNELLSGSDEDEHLRNEGEGPLFHGI